jgi:hypothetical protein
MQRQPLAAILGDFSNRSICFHQSLEATKGGLSSDICTMWYRAPEVLITQACFHFQAAYGKLELPWRS